MSTVLFRLVRMSGISKKLLMMASSSGVAIVMNYDENSEKERT